jgi:hypothetical protein
MTIDEDRTREVPLRNQVESAEIMILIWQSNINGHSVTAHSIQKREMARCFSVKYKWLLRILKFTGLLPYGKFHTSEKIAVLKPSKWAAFMGCIFIAASMAGNALALSDFLRYFISSFPLPFEFSRGSLFTEQGWNSLKQIPIIF